MQRTNQLTLGGAMTSGPRLIADAITIGGGGGVGRGRLQKMFYLLEQIGLGAELDFEYHHYGPYSRQVDESIDMAKAFYNVREEIHHRALDGMPYSVFKRGGRGGAKLGNLTAAEAAKLIESMKGVSSTVLEIAATIHWLTVHEKIADWR